jgi:hypothetical protein
MYIYIFTYLHVYLHTLQNIFQKYVFVLNKNHRVCNKPLMLYLFSYVVSYKITNTIQYVYDILCRLTNICSVIVPIFTGLHILKAVKVESLPNTEHTDFLLVKGLLERCELQD